MSFSASCYFFLQKKSFFIAKNLFNNLNQQKSFPRSQGTSGFFTISEIHENLQNSTWSFFMEFGAFRD